MEKQMGLSRKIKQKSTPSKLNKKKPGKTSKKVSKGTRSSSRIRKIK
jgi:hypothetical protein